jgi:hypothetical protein
MANSIPDLNITDVDWIDVYSTSGIAVGTKLIIQNKASNPVLMYIAPSKPSISSYNGYAIKSLETVSLDASETGCWVRGNGVINVQQG